ncbi:DNA alkylation repair protein [Thalassotalea sp. M1531]|uniref:DNA alkylation repair protein n=1 Tax=Thalassotalea algicola TaxID=2716224 RepID=A0A7Y0L8S8_9GAMM|nr:DNA alkylation repair protein [Thalassotalea algicola]NMP30069.1 DNA alkylation repair protein [Thalassotalea algicola]
MDTAHEITNALHEVANKQIAEHSQRFFKTAEGEYGAGDKFLGIRIPQIRQIIKQCKNTPLDEVEKLLTNEFHEIRLCALLILVSRFKLKRCSEHQAIFDLYINNLKFVNNWDLVDSSAHPIVGGYLVDKERTLLFELAKSDNLWRRRIAIIATYHFIKRDDFDDALALSKLLLADQEDLIHKAVGWMLREIGNRDYQVEYDFLKCYFRQMPRTMLRYAIEKFDEDVRQQFLKDQF